MPASDGDAGNSAVQKLTSPRPVLRNWRPASKKWRQSLPSGQREQSASACGPGRGNSVSREARDEQHHRYGRESWTDPEWLGVGVAIARPAGPFADGHLYRPQRTSSVAWIRSFGVSQSRCVNDSWSPRASPTCSTRCTSNGFPVPSRSAGPCRPASSDHRQPRCEDRSARHMAS